MDVPDATDLAAPPREFRHFGDLLKIFREAYGDRLRRQNPGMPRLKLTATALVRCLNDHDYVISGPTYTEIESGANIPKRPDDFLRIASTCLGLEAAERDALRQQLSFDVVRGRAGLAIARATVAPAQLPGFVRVD